MSGFLRRWTTQKSSGGDCLCDTSLVVNDVPIDFTVIARDDHLFLIGSAPNYPFFEDYGGVVPTSDWMSNQTPSGKAGLFWTDNNLRMINALNVASITGVGAEVIHQATPTAAIQTAGDVTLRCSLLANGLTNGMTFKLVSCQGVGSWTAADNNVRYELSLIDPNVIAVKHESGTNVQHEAEFTLLFDLDPEKTYDICGRRSADNWTVFLNGYQINYISSITGGTGSNDGVFSASSPTENGSLAVGSYEARGSRIMLTEAIGSALTDSEISNRVIADTEPRLAPIAKSNAEILEIFETGNELMFLIADQDAPDGLIERVGSLAGTWFSKPALITQAVDNAIWAKGSGNQTGYRSTSQVPDVLVGGDDFVYRFFGVWQEGNSLSELRRLFGASANVGSRHVHGYGYWASNSEFAMLNQYGAKIDSGATFKFPFELQNGDPYLGAVEQRDNGDGTQTVTLWMNGRRGIISDASRGGRDNRDGSAILTDASVNGATEWCWMATGFSATSVFSWNRFLQIDYGTTSDANEEALALALLGELPEIIPLDISPNLLSEEEFQTAATGAVVAMRARADGFEDELGELEANGGWTQSGAVQRIIGDRWATDGAIYVGPESWTSGRLYSNFTVDFTFITDATFSSFIVGWIGDANDGVAQNYIWSLNGTNANTFTMFIETGFGSNRSILFTAPTTRVIGDISRAVLRCEDNGDGTGEYSLHINGVACNVASVSGVNNGTSATVDLPTDGLETYLYQNPVTPISHLIIHNSVLPI